MIIMSYCDSSYFGFCDGLVKSIRRSGNEHQIFLYLLDFKEEEKEYVLREYENDSKINFRFRDSASFGYDIKDKINFYRNCRPRFFLELLNEYPDTNLLTFGANGLVWDSLDYIERDLIENDFVFLERTKKTDDGTVIKNISEFVNYLDSRGMSVDDMFSNSWPGKLVLLGTHGIQNNKHTKAVVENWMNYIEDPKIMNSWFSDMSLFVKCYIEYQKNMNYLFKKKTGWELPREDNPYVDTLFTTKKIWFAKAENKWENEQYLNALSIVREYEYSL